MSVTTFSSAYVTPAPGALYNRAYLPESVPGRCALTLSSMLFCIAALMACGCQFHFAAVLGAAAFALAYFGEKWTRERVQENLEISINHRSFIALDQQAKLEMGCGLASDMQNLFEEMLTLDCSHLPLTPGERDRLHYRIERVAKWDRHLNTNNLSAIFNSVSDKPLRAQLKEIIAKKQEALRLEGHNPSNRTFALLSPRSKPIISNPL